MYFNNLNSCYIELSMSFKYWELLKWHIDNCGTICTGHFCLDGHRPWAKFHSLAPLTRDDTKFSFTLPITTSIYLLKISAFLWKTQFDAERGMTLHTPTTRTEYFSCNSFTSSSSCDPITSGLLFDWLRSFVLTLTTQCQTQNIAQLTNHVDVFWISCVHRLLLI